MPQTIKAKDGTELDASVVNLARSIRKVESGDKYDAKGGSGEYGAYQWMPGNYESGARELGIDPNDKNPINQDKVAYHQLKKLKDKGYSPEQVAAAWNAGEGSVKGDAWKTRVGVNKYGVAYDTPGYVNKVVQNFQQLKGQAPQMAQATPQPIQEPKDEKSFGRKALEFAFPILEKKERTPLQAIGDTALSALWFIPGGGTAAAAGLRGLGLGAKAARAGAILGTAAGTGYAADVASGLSQGETGAEALKPGIGTAIGGATGLLGSKLATRYSREGVLQSTAKGNNEVFKQWKKTSKELSESFSKGGDLGALIASKGINVKNLVDAENIAYDTLAESKKLFDESRKLSQTVSQSLAKVKGAKPVLEIEEGLLKNVPKNFPEEAQRVRDEMSLLRQQYGDAVDATALNEWKQRLWEKSAFKFGDTSEITEAKRAYRRMGNYLKKEVEALAKAGGAPDVAQMNSVIGQHLDAAEMLERIHGNKARGGRLGNLIQQGVLQTTGGIGGFAGAGPLGALAGLIAGHYGSKVLSAIIRYIEGGPIQSKILKRIQEEQPEIIQQFRDFVAKDPQALQLMKQQLLLLPEKTSTQPGGNPLFVGSTGKAAPSLQEAVDIQGLLKPPGTFKKLEPRIYDESYVPDEELPVIDFGPGTTKKKGVLPVIR